MKDSYRPNFGSGQPPPRMPDNVRDGMFAFDGVRRPANGNARRPPPRNRDGRQRPYHSNPRPFRSMASRPLLSQQDRGDQQVLRDISAADRFRNIDELTDSEEDDMSESDDDGPQRKKQRRIEEQSPAATAAPKWSNPDPYTALPPVAEGMGKRTDVLKLIRKAKITSDKEAAEKPEQSEDFISFDFDEEDEQQHSNGPASNMRRQNPFQDNLAPFDGPAGDSLGKRRRHHEDAIPRPPQGYLPPNQAVLPNWIAPTSINPTPWLETRSSTDSAGIA
jgi:non-canonical poly(A) RNA polymerase PAPD5/7